MNSYVGYIRVSTQKQGEGVSLIEQRSAIEFFAAQQGLKVVRWYEEQVTAAKKGRPAFNAMLKDLKRRKAAGVIFHKIDRSSRNFGDWGKLGELHENGIDIRFANESLDFNSRGGRLAADVQMVVAADYIRNLREECMKGLVGRLKQGIYPFKAPIGYLDTGKGKPKAIDPDRGPLVRTLFELYATGNYSFRSIAPEMARRGLVSSKGRPLPRTSLEGILKNPFYAGVMTVDSFGQSYLGKHEPLISAALFETVAEVRGVRVQKKATKHLFRYRCLIKCAGCQTSLIAERQKGHVYYRCQSKSCPVTSLREDRLERAVCEFLAVLRFSDADANRLLTQLKKHFSNGAEAAALDHADKMHRKTEDRLSSLTDKFLDDLIDVTTYNEKKKSLLLESQKWDALIQERPTLPQKIQRLSLIVARLQDASSAYELAADDQKREILKLMTSNRQFDGKNLALEPSKQAQALSKLAKMSECGHFSATPRTQEELRHQISVLLGCDG